MNVSQGQQVTFVGVIELLTELGCTFTDDFFDFLKDYQFDQAPRSNLKCLVRTFRRAENQGDVTAFCNEKRCENLSTFTLAEILLHLYFVLKQTKVEKVEKRIFPLTISRSSEECVLLLFYPDEDEEDIYVDITSGVVEDEVDLIFCKPWERV